MNARINLDIQTIKGADVNPAFVVLRYEDFFRLYAKAEHLIPNEVVGKIIMDELTPIRAWREHLGLTQTQVAERMGITQAAFAQMEAPDAKPRKSTLRKVAAALGLAVEQLDV